MRRRSVFLLALFLTATVTLSTLWFFQSRRSPNAAAALDRRAVVRSVRRKRNALTRSGTITSAKGHVLDSVTREILKSIETLERRTGDLMRKYETLQRARRSDFAQQLSTNESRGREEEYRDDTTNRREIESQSDDDNEGWSIRDERRQHGSNRVTNSQTNVSDECRKVPTFHDFFPALDDKYPIQTNRKLVIIVTAMRSGSSFLGTILDQSDETLYIFEPFWYLQHLYHEKPDLNDLKIRLMKSISTCRFDKEIAKSVIELISKSFQFARLYSRTFVDYPLCPDACINDCPPMDVDLLNRICLSKSIVVIKTIRILDMSILKHVHENAILNDPEFIGSQPAQLHIIHLVRDPRGTMHSRLNIKGIVEKRYRLRHHYKKRQRLPSLKEIILSDANALCNETLGHINFALQAPNWLLGRYFRIRFEDVATQPRLQMTKLMAMYGLQVTDRLVKWIEWNTNAAGAGGYTYGTRRKSVDVPHKWRIMLTKVHTRKFVQIIEQSCSSLMEVMDYIPEF